MEQKSIGVAIVLSIVTFGIYWLYWKYTIARGFCAVQTQEQLETSPGITILLYVLTGGIYGWYAYYKWGRASIEVAARYGRKGEEKGILYLILAIFGFSIVNDALIQSDFNNWLSYRY